MPVIIQDSLLARNILEDENICVLGEPPARIQTIRPLRLAILNLMPTKIATETQLLRLVSNSTFPIEVTLLKMDSHDSKNTLWEHLSTYYHRFEQIEDEKFDGMIITGAPVEHLPFEEVDYWGELQSIMDWTDLNVASTLHICWAAQAALYHRYRIPKYPLPEKMFGVYRHNVSVRNEKILRGFDDQFFAPHSRHTEIRREDIEKESELDILSESGEAGIYIVASKNRRCFYVTGHAEYDPWTLKTEYQRDIDKGLTISIPKNYFPDDDPSRSPEVRWRGHAHLLFSNWINFYVYQSTP